MVLQQDFPYWRRSASQAYSLVQELSVGKIRPERLQCALPTIAPVGWPVIARGGGLLSSYPHRKRPTRIVRAHHNANAIDTPARRIVALPGPTCCMAGCSTSERVIAEMDVG